MTPLFTITNTLQLLKNYFSILNRPSQDFISHSNWHFMILFLLILNVIGQLSRKSTVTLGPNFNLLLCPFPFAWPFLRIFFLCVFSSRDFYLFNFQLSSSKMFLLHFDEFCFEFLAKYGLYKLLKHPWLQSLNFQEFLLHFFRKEILFCTTSIVYKIGNIY